MEDLVKLMRLNNQMLVIAQDNFNEMNSWIDNEMKKLETHYHFKTEEEMRRAMACDYNPHNTFSFGDENPNQ